MANDSSEKKTDNLGNDYKTTFYDFYESERGTEVPPRNNVKQEIGIKKLKKEIEQDNCYDIPLEPDNKLYNKEKAIKARETRKNKSRSGYSEDSISK